ncbi:MAG TPA: hypothetical protein VHX12_08580 [Acidisoma sp.]|nr:hypothetical protein [Acidisoma sp.]
MSEKTEQVPEPTPEGDSARDGTLDMVGNGVPPAQGPIPTPTGEIPDILHMDRLGEGSQGAAGGDYIIDPKIEANTAKRLKDAGVTQANFRGDKVLAEWVADGLAKVRNARMAVPPVIEINTAPFNRRSEGVAYYDGNRKAIYLNSRRVPADVAAAAVSNFRIQNWSSADPHHPLLHEVGHYNHHLAAGDADFKRAIKPGSIKNFADASLIEREVGTYARTSRANFVAEVFAGRSAGRTFPSTVMRLYYSMGGP